MSDNTTVEKVALLGIAGIAVGSLTTIGLTAINAGAIDANGATLVGVIVGGLIACTKDIVQAVRGYSMSAQLGKVTDQLSRSRPAAPDDAPSGSAEDPISTRDAP